MLTGNILITGGAGTLGQAIIARAQAKRWPCHFTVYSRDPLKHQQLRHRFPAVRTVLGDIRDGDRLTAVMVGHSTVIHAAAQKHIPEAEAFPSNCFETNVFGSQMVARAAVGAGVAQVVAISTDKACHPISAYGHSKAMMEYVWHEWAGDVESTSFHCCRYGNVIGSNGSVLQLWRRQQEAGRTPTITNGEMTRFWLTEEDAVDLVLEALAWPSGTCVVPLAPALSMANFAYYLLGDVELEEIGLRPGEKMHEMLIAPEELAVMAGDSYAVLGLRDQKDATRMPAGYTSDAPLHTLTERELRTMVGSQETSK